MKLGNLQVGINLCYRYVTKINVTILVLCCCVLFYAPPCSILEFSSNIILLTFNQNSFSVPSMNSSSIVGFDVPAQLTAKSTMVIRSKTTQAYLLDITRDLYSWPPAPTHVLHQLMTWRHNQLQVVLQPSWQHSQQHDQLVINFSSVWLLFFH